MITFAAQFRTAMIKTDILAFGVHPDDVELGCSGTLIAAVQEGKKVAVIDLTQGELGTRGTAETRKVEAAEAARIMGVHARENLQMADGFSRLMKPISARWSPPSVNTVPKSFFVMHWKIVTPIMAAAPNW